MQLYSGYLAIRQSRRENQSGSQPWAGIPAVLSLSPVSLDDRYS